MVGLEERGVLMKEKPHSVLGRNFDVFDCPMNVAQRYFIQSFIPVLGCSADGPCNSGKGHVGITWRWSSSKHAGED